MSKELMIERIEKAQKEIEAKRETVQQGKSIFRILGLYALGTCCQ